jgi:hypothetical protein
MVRSPAPAVGSCLIDNFQCVALMRSHSSGAQQRAQRAHVASLATDDFPDFVFGDFQFNHVVIKMIDKDLIGSVDDPFRNLFDERANVWSAFRHGIAYATDAAGAATGLE